MAELELNKIVGMIMENPELVEKIKAMGEASAENKSEPKESLPNEDAARMPTYTVKTSKRNELLRALEAFLSEERKRSLETMMTIADVLDSVKRKEN